MSHPESAVFSAILVCLGGAVLTLLLARLRTLAGLVALLVAAASSGLVYTAIAQVLSAGPGQPVVFLPAPQWGFAVRLHVDGLSAVFLAVAATVALPTSLYALAYMRHYPQYSLARYYPHFLVFQAAMYGLVTTTDMMWFFLIFWQMMTLPGYALIRFEYRRPENVRAANKYMIMMQIACIATMVGAALIVSGGSAPAGPSWTRYDFEFAQLQMPSLLQNHPGRVIVALALFLIGFGIKMGMWPFGAVWLPDAHPAAPSPMSAMLSGVMIKTGVYGLVRYFFCLLPQSTLATPDLKTWGGLIAALGTLTLFLGTIQALRQDQSKRLLAFHSIGQIGYILLGTGACLVLLPSSNPAMAGLGLLALVGALFHTINHALFKALLFLNAGSLLYTTGTQDLNRMGGLAKYMPLTAVTTLVASFSIAGVPLFNGFASKWTLYVATIQGAAIAPYLAVFALIAILTSALTLASFMKFFGVSFLSRGSSEVIRLAAAGKSLEVNGLMLIAQTVLAALCLLLGILPSLGMRIILLALSHTQGGLGSTLAKLAAAQEPLGLGLTAFGEKALYAPLALLLTLALAYLVAVGLSRLGGATRRKDAPWLCGYAREMDHYRYTAHNFYGELKRWSRWLGGKPRPANKAASPPSPPSGS